MVKRQEVLIAPTSWADVSANWEGLLASILPIAAPVGPPNEAGFAQHPAPLGSGERARTPAPASTASRSTETGKKKKKVHRNSLANARVSESKTTLQDQNAHGARVKSDSKSRKPKDKHRKILKDKEDDTAYHRKPHQTSPVDTPTADAVARAHTQHPSESRGDHVVRPFASLHLIPMQSGSVPAQTTEVALPHPRFSYGHDGTTVLDTQACRLATVAERVSNLEGCDRQDIGRNAEHLRKFTIPPRSVLPTDQPKPPAKADQPEPLAKAQTGQHEERPRAGSVPKKLDEDDDFMFVHRRLLEETEDKKGHGTQIAYPHTDACYLPQSDMYDGGMPPDVRVPLSAEHASAEQTFVVFDISLKHVPQMIMSGKCGAFLQVRYDSESSRTNTVINSGSDCSWPDEVFELVFTMGMVQTLENLDPAEGSHRFISIVLYGENKGRQQRLSYVSIDLLNLFHLSDKSGDIELDMEAFDPSIENGTTISMRINRKVEALSDWVPPTLEETLASSHDNIAGMSFSPKNIRRPSRQSSKMARQRMVISDSSRKPAILEFEPGDKDAGNDEHWREVLERRMESMAFNLFIVFLVVCDVSVAVVFLVRYSASYSSTGRKDMSNLADIFEMTWNIIINAFMLFEVTLRQVASRSRFWKSKLNVFDFVVVWLAALAIAVDYSMIYWLLASNSNLKGDLGDVMVILHNAGIIRIASRLVYVARFIRILRMAQKLRYLSGQMNDALRMVVSQNKRRMLWNGFDLDLTYITSRIVAMSVPGLGTATAYRNNIHQVSRYLALRHYGHFFIFNLCDTYDSSDGSMGQYHPSMLYNKVQRVPFEDHSPPLLGEMVYLCQQASSFMAQDPKNIVCIHCKGGKGRTGVMIAALMMWTAHRRSALDALELFAFRRTQDYDPTQSLDGAEEEEEEEEEAVSTVKEKSLWSRFAPLLCGLRNRSKKNNQGAEGPSQIRYVHYLQAVLYNGIDPWSQKQRILNGITFPRCAHMGRKTWYFSFTLQCHRVLLHDSFATNGFAYAISAHRHDTMKLDLIEPLSGDVRLDLYVHQHATRSTRKLACFITFNTHFCEGRNELHFKKRNIDMFHKDRKNKKVPSDFAISISFAPDYSEDPLRELFAQAGQRITYKKGEVVVKHGMVENTLVYIESGTIEGIIEQNGEFHPLGYCVPEHRECASSQFFHAHGHRVPISCILGSGAVVGASQFLLRKSSMTFRVRSDEAQVLVITANFENVNSALKLHASSFTLKLPAKKFRRQSSMARVTSMFSGTVKRTPTIQDIEDAFDKSTQAITFLPIKGLLTESCAVLYHELAKKLVLQLDRMQIEAYRILSLRAMNETESILKGGGTENLRQNCLKRCTMPIHEKIVDILRCSCQMPVKGNRKAASFPRIRLLILNTYLVLDSEYFGPEVSKDLILINHTELHSVCFLDQHTKTTLVVTMRGDLQSKTKSEPSFDSEAGLECNEYKMTFHTEGHAYRAFVEISRMCRAGTNARESITTNVHRSPLVVRLAKACGKLHLLNQGEELSVIKTLPALFVVRTGSLVLKRRDKISRIVCQGSSCGISSFVQGRCDGIHDAFAGCDDTVILELSHANMSRFMHEDAGREADFFYFLCVLIQSELDDLWHSIFPSRAPSSEPEFLSSPPRL